MASKKTYNKTSNRPKEIIENIDVEKNDDVIAIPPKKERTVVLATANYYIIDVDGFNMTIKCRNNYKNGDIVLY